MIKQLMLSLQAGQWYRVEAEWTIDCTFKAEQYTSI